MFSSISCWFSWPLPQYLSDIFFLAPMCTDSRSLTLLNLAGYNFTHFLGYQQTLTAHTDFTIKVSRCISLERYDIYLTNQHQHSCGESVVSLDPWSWDPPSLDSRVLITPVIPGTGALISLSVQELGTPVVGPGSCPHPWFRVDRTHLGPSCISAPSVRHCLYFTS
jgi:hypothetical protein